jgi:hypothetical protein
MLQHESIKCLYQKIQTGKIRIRQREESNLEWKEKEEWDHIKSWQGSLETKKEKPFNMEYRNFNKT